MSDRAVAIASLVVPTPSVDAPIALEILVDTLLEDALVEPDGAEGLRRRAWSWARRRFMPSPLERFAQLVLEQLAGEELPPFVVGVVEHGLVRVHFLGDLPVHRHEHVRHLARSAAPGAYYLEISCRHHP